MLEYYDPNYCFGTHTIRVTIQMWKYRGWFEYKADGNCKGACLMDDVPTYIEGMKNIESNCNFKIIEDDDEELWYSAILKDDDGNECEIEDELDELEKHIVKIEIIDFQPGR